MVLFTVANVACASFARLADWLYGCSHDRTTFPITLRSDPGSPAETYIVCLQCGRHLDYNWTAMHLTTRADRAREQGLAPLRAFGGTKKVSQ
jgi:hypothetical protein